MWTTGTVSVGRTPSRRRNSALANPRMRAGSTSIAFTLSQLVVDGKLQFVGSDGHEARAAIEKERHEQKLAIAISNVVRTGNQVTAHIEIPTTQIQSMAAPLSYMLPWLITKPSPRWRAARTRAGLWFHVAVVRSLAQVGTIRGANPVGKQVTLSVQPGAGTNGLRIVAFLQDPGSGHILGAALHKLQ